MRIALLFQPCGELPRARRAVHCLADGLRRAGHEVDVLALGDDPAKAGGVAGLAARTGAVADGALAKRGFVTPLAHLPLTVAGMLLRRHEVAHAFSAPGAAAALIWRRFTNGGVVFTSIEPVERARLAHRRLMLRLMRQACEDSDAVTVPDAQAQAALLRWMALEAPVIELGDVNGYERLYRSLASPRRT